VNSRALQNIRHPCVGVISFVALSTWEKWSMWVVVPLHTISSQLTISITIHSFCFELGYGSKITTPKEQVAHCGMALALTPSSNQQHSNAP
jgi:hypothetical protein